MDTEAAGEGSNSLDGRERIHIRPMKNDDYQTEHWKDATRIQMKWKRIKLSAGKTLFFIIYMEKKLYYYEKVEGRSENTTMIIKTVLQARSGDIPLELGADTKDKEGFRGAVKSTLGEKATTESWNAVTSLGGRT